MSGPDDVSSATYRGTWRTWTRPSAPPLTGVVDYHGFDVVSGEPMTDTVLPGPTLTLILSFGDKLTMEQMPGSAAAGGTFVSFVAGMHDRHGTIGHDGRQAGVQVDLDPLVARAALGAGVGDLAGDVVPVDAVLGRAGELLAERLADAPDWTSRFTILDQVLAEWTSHERRPRPEVAHAWRVVRGSKGTARIEELAREVGWSRRHLAEQFRREIGLTPKAAARVVRFDHARWLLATCAGGTLTDIALRCGYYDHAHLDRDFRALAGRSPTALGDTALLTGDLPFVQDADARPRLA